MYFGILNVIESGIAFLKSRRLSIWLIRGLKGIRGWISDLLISFGIHYIRIKPGQGMGTDE